MRITFDIEISNSLPSDVLARVHYPHDVPPNKIIINKGLNAIELSEAIHHEIGHIFDWYLGQSGSAEIREQNAEIIGEAIRFRKSFGNQAKNTGE